MRHEAFSRRSLPAVSVPQIHEKTKEFIFVEARLGCVEGGGGSVFGSVIRSDWPLRFQSTTKKYGFRKMEIQFFSPFCSQLQRVLHFLSVPIEVQSFCQNSSTSFYFIFFFVGKKT